VAPMRNFKRHTQEYINELKDLKINEEIAKSEKSKTKITVEPFMLGAKKFDPKQNDFIVKIHKNNNKIGFLAVTHKKAGIMPINIEVHEDHRRQGHGTSLVNAAMKLSGKDYIPSPDQTPDAKAFNEGRMAKIKKAEFEKKAKQLHEHPEFNELLLKSVKPADISNSTILFHPVSFGNKSVRQENNYPIHMTVKAFGNNADINQVHNILNDHNLHKPIDTSKITLMPHKLQGLDGATHHVLLVYGLPNRIHQIREHAKDMGPKFSHFLPHISVDKEMWDQFSKLGPSFSAKDVNLKFHPAELKNGHKVIKTY
jgi:hypothetical protein